MGGAGKLDPGRDQLAFPAVISSQQICWLRTYAGGMPCRLSIPSTTEVHEPELA